ncbi:TPA: hypothetical protein ACPWS4_003962 [Pseudomonas aeruginosa]
MSKDIICVSERTSCQCEGPVPCTCPPYDELVFMVNGKGGFGGGDLVMNPKTGEEFFACRFMGREFQAGGAHEAKEKLRTHFLGFEHVQVI